MNDKIDGIIRRFWEGSPIPGLTIGVVQHGQIIHLDSLGVASLESRTPVESNTTFPIASLTKQFVAKLILMLAQDGLFELDESISKWFPVASTVWKSITIRDLLTHQSGISDARYNALDDEDEISEEDLVAIIARTPLKQEPGTKFEYCNSGYVLLGALVRRVTGKFYGEVLKERIFSPLGMITARVFEEGFPGLAVGYESEGDLIDIESWVHPSLCTPADGGLCMSISDMAKWACGLDAGFPSPEILSQVWTPSRLRNGQLAGYSALRVGMGWMIPHVPHLPGLVQHEGSFRGFTSYIGRIREQGLTVAILTNLDDSLSKPKVIGQEILAALKQ